MPSFSLWEYPSYLAGQVSKVAQHRLLQALARHELRLAQLAALVALHDVGPVSQQELARVLALDKSQVVAIVDDLAGRQLLRRAVDGTDRRRHRIALTAKGRALVPRLLRTVDASQRAVFAPLSSDERATLAALLRRVLVAARADDHVHAAPGAMAGSA